MGFMVFSSIASLAVIVLLRDGIARSTNHYLYVTLGAIGIVTHEIGHLLAAIFFRHKIVSFQPFKPNKVDGSLGYVIHRYQPSIISPIANLVIGIAPLFTGIAVFYFITAIMRPDVLNYFLVNCPLNGDLSHVLMNLQSLFEIVLTPSHNGYLTALWLFLSYSVLVHCVPSKADLSQSSPGMAILLVAIFFISMICPDVIEIIVPSIYAINYTFALVTIALIVIFIVTKSIEVFSSIIR